MPRPTALRLRNASPSTAAALPPKRRALHHTLPARKRPRGALSAAPPELLQPRRSARLRDLHPVRAHKRRRCADENVPPLPNHVSSHDAELFASPDETQPLVDDGDDDDGDDDGDDGDDDEREQNYTRGRPHRLRDAPVSPQLVEVELECREESPGGMDQWPQHGVEAVSAVSPVSQDVQLEGLSLEGEVLARMLRQAAQVPHEACVSGWADSEGSSQARLVLVDWMVEVANEYQARSQTLALGVTYLDRFLAAVDVPRGDLQLVAAVAMLLATKIEETAMPSMEDVVYLCDHLYSRSKVIAMEKTVVHCFDFRLTYPTHLTILGHLAGLCFGHDKAKTRAVEFAGLVALHDERLCTWSAAGVALGCVVAVCEMTGSQASLDLGRYADERQLHAVVRDARCASRSVQATFRRVKLWHDRGHDRVIVRNFPGVAAMFARSCARLRAPRAAMAVVRGTLVVVVPWRARARAACGGGAAAGAAAGAAVRDLPR